MALGAAVGVSVPEARRRARRAAVYCRHGRRRHRHRRLRLGVVAHRADDLSALYVRRHRRHLPFAHGERPDWDERMDDFAGYVVDAVREATPTRRSSSATVRARSSPSRCSTARFDARPGARPARAAAAAAHHRRQPSHHRLSPRGAVVPRPIEAAGTRARPRLGRLPVAPRHHEFLAVRSGRRARHRDSAPSGATRWCVAISFRDLWIPGELQPAPWRFFKAHFQFLTANERLGAAYDYYLICCGPLDLMSRAHQGRTRRSGPGGGPDQLRHGIELPAIAYLV